MQYRPSTKKLRCQIVPFKTFQAIFKKKKKKKCMLIQISQVQAYFYVFTSPSSVMSSIVPRFIGNLMSSILHVLRRLWRSARFCSSLVSMAVICFWITALKYQLKKQTLTAEHKVWILRNKIGSVTLCELNKTKYLHSKENINWAQNIRYIDLKLVISK